MRFTTTRPCPRERVFRATGGADAGHATDAAVASGTFTLDTLNRLVRFNAVQGTFTQARPAGVA